MPSVNAQTVRGKSGPFSAGWGHPTAQTPPPFSNEPGVSEKSLASQLLHFGVKTYHLIDFISADSQTHDNQGKTGLPLFLENLERFGNSKMVRKKSGKMQKKIWKTSWNLCNVGKFV